MSLTVRHRWCVEKITQCFKGDGVDEAKVQGFIRRPDVLDRFNELFAGDSNINSTFVHYQALAKEDSPNHVSSSLFGFSSFQPRRLRAHLIIFCFFCLSFAGK